MLSSIVELGNAVTLPLPVQFFHSRDDYTLCWPPPCLSISIMNGTSSSCARAECLRPPLPPPHCNWVADTCLLTSFCLANIAQQPFAWHVRFRSHAVMSLRFRPLAVSGFSAFNIFLTYGAPSQGLHQETAQALSAVPPEYKYLKSRSVTFR